MRSNNKLSSCGPTPNRWQLLGKSWGCTSGGVYVPCICMHARWELLSLSYTGLRWLRSLLLYLRYVFQAPINSFVCWFLPGKGSHAEVGQARGLSRHVIPDCSRQKNSGLPGVLRALETLAQDLRRLCLLLLLQQRATLLAEPQFLQGVQTGLGLLQVWPAGERDLVQPLCQTAVRVGGSSSSVRHRFRRCCSSGRNAVGCGRLSQHVHRLLPVAVPLLGTARAKTSADPILWGHVMSGGWWEGGCGVSWGSGLSALSTPSGFFLTSWQGKEKVSVIHHPHIYFQFNELFSIKEIKLQFLCAPSPL